MIYTRAAAALLALALGFTAGWQTQGWRWRAADADRIEATSEAERLRRMAQDRATERNDRETSQALARAHSAALAARGDLERLRVAAGAAAADPAASAAGCSDDGRLGQLTRLLAEGAGLVEEGSRRVEQLAAEKAALQRHLTEGP